MGMPDSSAWKPRKRRRSSDWVSASSVLGSISGSSPGQASAAARNSGVVSLRWMMGVGRVCSEGCVVLAGPAEGKPSGRKRERPSRRVAWPSGKIGGGASAYLGLSDGPRLERPMAAFSPSPGSSPPSGAGADSRASVCHSSWLHMGRGRSASVNPVGGGSSPVLRQGLNAKAAARSRMRKGTTFDMAVRRCGKTSAQSRACGDRCGEGRGQSPQVSCRVRGGRWLRPGGGRPCHVPEARLIGW